MPFSLMMALVMLLFDGGIDVVKKG